MAHSPTARNGGAHAIRSQGAHDIRSIGTLATLLVEVSEDHLIGDHLDRVATSDPRATYSWRTYLKDATRAANRNRPPEDDDDITRTRPEAPDHLYA